MLHVIPEGYIKTDARGEPTFVVERCPPELRDSMGNVVALMPVRRMEVIEVSLADLIVARARQLAEERRG